MGEQELLALYQLIASMPGKTMSQKLNFFQDMSGTLGVDLFGGETEPFVEQQFVDTPNEVDAVWGRDPVASVLFDAIDEGMSPLEAYQAALDQELIKKPAYGETPLVNYLDLASQYAAAEAGRTAERNKFDAEQANKRSIFESKQGPTLSDLLNPPTVFEATGSLSEKDLAKEFAAGDSRFRSPSNMAKRQGAAGFANVAKKAALQPFKMAGKNVSEQNITPVSSSFSDDPVLNQYVERLTRERARQTIPKMQSRVMPTEKGQQAMQAMAMMRLFGG